MALDFLASSAIRDELIKRSTATTAAKIITCNAISRMSRQLDVSNNPAIRAEDDPGTARSKQTTSKRKKVKSNDCNKKPRK